MRPASDHQPPDEQPVDPIGLDDLTLGDLPHRRAPFDEVVRFAYTFDGYAALGMELCGEMANRGLSHWARGGELPAWLAGDIERLRACLFFEARRWIVLEREPDTRARMYVADLVLAIEDHLLARDAST